MRTIYFILFGIFCHAVLGRFELTKPCRKADKYDTVYGVVGGSVAMRCSPKEKDKKPKTTVKFIWKRGRDGSYLFMDSTSMNTDPRMRTNSTALSRTMEKHLIIDQLQESDESFYECLIIINQENTFPTHYNNCIRLIVLVPPVILSNESSSQVLTVNEGESVKLHCSAIGKPEPNVTWRLSSAQNLQYGSDVTDPQAILHYGNTYLIRKISRRNAGSYICNANNGVSPTANYHFTVNVHYKPVTRMMNERIGQSRHKQTMIRGEISGYPVEEISWQFNSRRLNVSPSSCMSLTQDVGKYCYALEHLADVYHTWRATLWIINLSRNDFGNYTLAVKSPFGSILKTAEVFEIKPQFTQVNYDKENEDELQRRQVMQQVRQKETELLQSGVLSTQTPRGRASYFVQKQPSLATTSMHLPSLSLFSLLVIVCERTYFKCAS